MSTLYKNILLCLFAFVGSIEASAQTAIKNHMILESFGGNSGDTITIQLNMINPDIEVCAFQCDITLPTTMSIIPGSISKGERLVPNCILDSDCINDSTYRIVYCSGKNIVVSDHNGTVATFRLAISNNTPDGDYPITIRNAQMVNATEACIEDYCRSFIIKVGEHFTPGDANGDGAIDVVDVTCTISEALGISVEGFNSKAADMNGDGEIDVVDVTMIISLALQGE